MHLSRLAAWLRSTSWKLDARADRNDGVLRVAAVHRDGPWSNTMTAAVDREIGDLARWLELELVLPD